MISELNALFRTLPHMPYRRMRRFLWRRFSTDRLSLVAGSLTFTTTMAIVPLFTVALVIFSTHPVFFDLQKVLQKWLIESLVPDAIARQVFGAITQFTTKAHRLGVAGFTILLVSALALVLTIDHTFNNIWRVKARRPMWKRLAVYSALLTLGPLLLASSLWLTTKVAIWSQPLVGISSVKLFYSVLEFVLVWVGLVALYCYVPHTYVRLRHACLGAFVAASALEVAKKLLTVYLLKVPAYSIIYGAFATVPVFLIWIYMAWLVILIGAEIVASLAKSKQ